MTTPFTGELAIFGGTPVFDQMLHVGRPNVGDRDRLFARLSHILDSRWLSNMGPYEREFEQRVADMLGTKHCVAMCNATVALELAVRALGLAGEVIVPSFTFIATVHALQWQGIIPVFCDIDPATHNIDARRVDELITERTTGIIGVHVWGRACAVQALEDIAKRHNLKLLFDAAHAFGCSHHGRPIGGFGAAEVFSFHATKILNTFEGGAVTTNDDTLAARIRLMKNFGFAGYDRVIQLGTNGKMSEVAAAMGLTLLESLADFIETNRRNYESYRAALADISGVRLLAFAGRERYTYQYIVVEIDDTKTGLTRDDLVQVLHAENVIARRYFYPGCHRMEPYLTLYPKVGLRLPFTEHVAGSVMTLPTGTAVGENEIALVCDIIRRAVSHGSEIHAYLASRGAEPCQIAKPDPRSLYHHA